MKNFSLLTLVLIFGALPLAAQQIILPVEVLGAEGKVVTRTFNLSSLEATSAEKLWLQVNNLSYQNKASIKINNGAWLSLNHQTVKMQGQEKARGGMVHGGFNTIRFSIPAAGFVAGANTISFRFDLSDAISNGYRVVRFNLLDASSTKILPDSRFVQDDPASWVAPYTDPTSIAEGMDLWYNGSLQSNYLPTNRKGFWYAAEISGGHPIQAKCSSCHTQDGRDLEIFSYSNDAIVERSKFHQLSEEEGKKIASYIRSLSTTKTNVGRWGRPWNPPYQPGPEVENMPIKQWAAGAGLDAVLDEDKDMVPYMFPNGINQEEVYDRFDSEKSFDRTLLPLAIQFPDWKHWLPMVHPMDAYNNNNYYLDPNTGPNNPHKNYQEVRAYLEANGPNFPNKPELLDKIQRLHNHFRFFVEQGGTENNHWRTGDGTATQNLFPDVSREIAATSLARLFAVKNFEFVQEFDLEDKAHLYSSSPSEVQPRQWPGDEYNVFEVPPHFQACVNNNCNQFMGQPTETGMYESTAWYQLQMVINGGDGFISHNSPVDYNYHPDFITKACNSSGVNEPMRYYHSMNVMYQTRTWAGGTSPNDGKGFRVRVMGPWNIYGITDGNQFNGFAPGEFAKTLDEVTPGMTAWVMNAMLRQFLTEVNKPQNNLAGWNRSENGNDNALDRANKTYAEIIDAVERTERQETFFEHYAAKMYYYIPRFQKLGVDCQIMEEVIDWCQAAWPNIDYHVFSNKGALQMSLLVEDEKFCSPTNRITAVTSNALDNTVYNWAVNGIPSSTITDKLTMNNLNVGDVVTCEISNNTSCLANNTVTATLTVPSKGYNLTMRKVGDPTFRPIESMVACPNDQVELKLNIDIQPKQWLDAMNVNNGAAPVDNSYITSWHDKSGNGFNASNNNNTGLNPKYVSNAMNGLPAVVFGADNNADGLILFDTNQDDFLEGDWTILFVGQSEKPLGNEDWRDIIGNKTEGANGWFFRLGSNARVQVGIGPTLQHGKEYDFNRSFIAQITKKGDVITSYLNGISDRVITRDQGMTMTINEALYLGQASNGSTGSNRYHKGPISELLVFESAISETQKQFLEGYLTNKWNVNNELVFTHPYAEKSPFDITLSTPDGAQLGFDAIQTSHTINLDQPNKFGDYDFNKQVCNTEESITIANDGMLAPAQDMVKYSVNNNFFEVGTELFADAGNQIRLKENYSLYGDYTWETPQGAMMTINTDPDFSLAQGVNDGLWILHVLSSTCASQEYTYSFNVRLNGPVVQTPFGGAVWPIPGQIEAEDYDIGGEGVSYHDVDVLNKLNAYRTTEGVDVEATGDVGGGYNVGWIETGEWLEYSVDVITAGVYTIETRIASGNAGTKTMHIEMDGVDISGPISLTTTPGWQAYETVTVSATIGTTGAKVMRIVIDAGGLNLNYVNFDLSIPLTWIFKGNTNAGLNYSLDSKINVSPNPVKVGTGLRISFENMESGTYTLNIYNSYGNALYQKVIAVASGDSDYDLPIGHNIASGCYQLEMLSEEGLRTIKKVVVY